MEEKKEFKIPDHVIDAYIKKYDQYPCITQTKNVIYSGIELLLKKNKLLWFNNFSDGENTLLREGLIDYSSTYKMMIYVSMVRNEKLYRNFIFSTTENKNNLDLLLKGLNKFYTIDMI
jgi:hypothetical protein